MIKIEEIKKEYEALFEQFKNCDNEKQYSIMLNKIKVLREMIETHSKINRISQEEIQFNKEHKNPFYEFLNSPRDFKDLDSRFSKDIFIVGANSNSGYCLLERIHNEYLQKEDILSVKKSKGNYEIIMNDGTRFKTILTSDSARGHRGRYAYIQYGVPLDIIENVIAPCVDGKFEIIR